MNKYIYILILLLICMGDALIIYVSTLKCSKINTTLYYVVTPKFLYGMCNNLMKDVKNEIYLQRLYNT